MAEPIRNRFGGWLEASMRSRGLTQAQLARSVGVADTQVSRWRRGQVVPTVQYLQRLADTFGIQRNTLDQLVGLPVAQAREGGEQAAEPELEAELQAYQARLRQAMQSKLPRSMWRAYVEACLALADGLGDSATRALRESLGRLEEIADDEPPPERPEHEPPPERPLGFRS
ncbi:MAG TPA: helix-turn-helix transcriptional regulator [Chloroflexota bacterium]|nr:helix-turn-helix transcriptional regulator [Chloroflexota bacterium]